MLPLIIVKGFTICFVWNRQYDKYCLPLRLPVANYPRWCRKMKVDNFKIKSADQFLSILSSGAVSSIVCSNHFDAASFSLCSKTEETFRVSFYLGDKSIAHGFVYHLDFVPLCVAYFLYDMFSKRAGYNVF